MELLGRLMARGGSGIGLGAMGGGRSGERQFGRLLENPRVTPGEMVATARRRLLARVEGRHVLVIQDTTSLRDDGRQRGVYLHPAVGVDAGDGALLGLLRADFLVRDGAQAVHCNQRRLGEKESRRWVATTEQAADLVAAGARAVTVVADREADLYESFALRPEGVEVLVRVHHDRRLSDGGRLHEACAGMPALGHSVITLRAMPGGKPRSARLAIHARPVGIKRPQRSRAELTAALPDRVELTLIEAREIDPPAGETALHWRLLSTRAVRTLAEAEQALAFYRQRWSIEQLFRVMKTRGFGIEAAALQEDASLKNLACATLIAAVQVQQMLHDRDGKAGRPMADVFEPADRPLIEAIGRTLQGKTERQKNPYPPGSLAHATWICARLGGWTGYYGKPGPIILIRGYQRLQTMIEGVKRSGLL
jgi:Transposase DDE domain